MFIVIGITLVQLLFFLSQPPIDDTAYGNREYYSEFVFSRETFIQSPWTLLSYALSHANWMHFIGNSSIALLVGIPIESMDGARVLVPWALAIILGALFHAVETPVGLVGASAGVYGLLATHAANLILNWEMKWPAPITKSVYITLIIALAIPPIADYILYSGLSNTSYSAHLGGAIGGFLGGLPILNVFHTNVHIWIRVCSTLAIVALTGGLILGFIAD
jgi:rhomboid-related protein 1/2/3